MAGKGNCRIWPTGIIAACPVGWDIDDMGCACIGHAGAQGEAAAPGHWLLVDVV